MCGCNLDRGPHAIATDPDEYRGLRLRCIHHRQAILCPPGGAPRTGWIGVVGVAVPPTVINDDPEMPRQIVHLGLPEPGMRDRGCRQEDDGLRACSEYLEVQLQSVFGPCVSGGIRLPRAGT